VLYQNDDYGKDYVKACAPGRSQGDPDRSLLRASDPTIDSQIVQLKAAGIDTMIEHPPPGQRTIESAGA